eukprot:410028-Pleurochrysis_carterae.AAC.1
MVRRAPCSWRSECVEPGRRARWVHAAVAMLADQAFRAVWPREHGPAACPTLCCAALRAPRSR